MEYIDTDIFVIDLHLDFFCLGKHRYRRRRSVYSALCLGSRYTLNAVYAAFVFQHFVRPDARYVIDRLFHASQLRGVDIHFLHAQTVRRAIVLIHAAKLCGKQRCLFTARASANL